MAVYDGATIEVVNWDKYNPRTDSKRPAWFRFENRIATGPGFFGLDCEQKWLWVFILSLVSEANGEPIVWNSAYAKGLTGISEEKQNLTIDIFVKFVRLRVTSKVTRRDSPTTRRDETKTNNTIDQISEEKEAPPRELELTEAAHLASLPEKGRRRRPASTCQFDLEAAYKRYPRKVGKSKGLQTLEREIKTDADYQALLGAIDRYSKSQTVLDGFIKHFSTFAHEWRDWTDEDAGQSTVVTTTINVKPIKIEGVA